MINDLFAGIDDSVQHSLSADDGAFWMSTDTLDEAIQLAQETLHTVENWSHTWGLEFSLDKTKTVFFSKKRPNPLPTLHLMNKPIKYVSEYKFLGVYFDRHLIWRSHISYVQERCQRDLRLLSMISNRRWGADFLSLRRSYLALTRPKLDYASFLFSTASKCHLLKLNRIQYAAARISLHAHRCTKVSLLESEAQLLPLSLRRLQLQSQYFCRTLSSGATLQSFLEPDLPYHLLSPVSIPPVSYRSLVGLTELDVPYKTILQITPQNYYKTVKLPAFNSFSGLNKESLSSESWQQLVSDTLQNKYPNHTVIYCDGSKNRFSCGCAVWSSEFQIKAKLPHSTSIFTAEMYAILCALLFSVRLPGPSVIFSDSLSCITSLQNPYPVRHYLINRILSLYSSHNSSECNIEWIPSHMGIPGNENADSLAKQSLTHCTITNLSLSLPDAYRLIKQKIFTKWLDLQTTDTSVIAPPPAPPPRTPPPKNPSDAHEKSHTVLSLSNLRI
mgnify:CR=1 FL=1